MPLVGSRSKHRLSSRSPMIVRGGTSYSPVPASIRPETMRIPSLWKGVADTPCTLSRVVVPFPSSCRSLTLPYPPWAQPTAFQEAIDPLLQPLPCGKSHDFTQERRTLVFAFPVRKDALVESEQRLPSCRPSWTLVREVVRFLPPDRSHTDARRFASLSLSHDSSENVRCFLLLDRQFLPGLSTREKQRSRRVRPISANPNLKCLNPHLVAFPVPRQGLHPGGENALWDTFPCR